MPPSELVDETISFVNSCSHTGHAASSGLRAAELAARGFTGASSVVEGPRGFFAGLAFLYSGIAQGRSCADAINAAKEKPEIFGLSIAPAAIIEGFAVFAFVFALVVSAGIPAAGGGS